MRLPNWKFKNHELERDDDAQRVQDAAWPDMFANLQSAYAELTNAQFELERRAAEIAETRDLVQQIVSSMSEALFLTDRAGRVIRANPAASLLLGCNEEAILGRPLPAVCNAEEIPATPWKLMEMTKGGKIATVDVDIQTFNGEAIPVSFSLTLMHDKQEKVTGVLAVARDMREQRALIASLVAARTRFQELLEFAPDAIVLANQEGKIVLVNSQTERLFGYNRESLLGQSVEMLVPDRYRQEDTADEETAEESARTPTRDDSLAAELGAPLLDEFPDELPNILLELDPRHDVQTALAIRNADERAQQIEFFVVDCHGREFPVEITQRPIVTEDGLLLMSVIRDISERKRIEMELSLSEERHRALAATAQDAILTINEKFQILFANSAAEKVFGYAMDELIGRSADWLLPQATLAFQTARTQASASNGNGHHALIEVKEQRKDGGESLLEIAHSQFEQEGHTLFTWFVRDISERRRMQQQLVESEERYRNVALTAAEVIVTIDSQGALQFANPAVTTVFGYAVEELVGQPLALLVPECVPSQSGAEVKGRHKLGHEIQIEASFSEFERDGARFYTGILHDITERKLIEQRLLESEQRYRSVVESATEVIVTVDETGAIWFTNPAITRLFGVTHDEIIGQNLSTLIPSYSQYVAAAQAHQQQPGAPPLAWSDVDVPGVRKNGAELLLNFSFSEFRREGKRYFTGIIRDITERKQAEAALRLNKRALEASAFPILIADAQAPDMPLMYVNPAFERATGYQAEEVLGRNCRFLQRDDRDQPGLDQLRAALKEGRDCTVVLRNYRKDGGLFHNELTVSPVFDEIGKLTHFIGFEHDVSERLEADARLRAATAVQRAIVDHAEYAIFTTDAAGQLTSFNPAAERLLGYAASEVVGQQTPALLHDAEELAERARHWSVELGQELPPGFDTLVAKSRLNLPNEAEWTYRRKDGSALPVILTTTALRDAQGEITGFLGIAGDITERKRAQERAAQLTSLRLALTNAFGETHAPLPDLLQNCVSAVVQGLAVAAARLWLLNDAGTLLELQASHGLNAAADPEQFVPLGQGHVGQVAKERKALLTNELAAPPAAVEDDVLVLEDEAAAATDAFPSLAAYPLLSGDKVCGVLAVYGHTPLANDLLNPLATVADTIVLGIERKRAELERLRAQAREAARLNHHTALRVEVSNALNEIDTPLQQVLRRCMESVVEHLDAAVGRIWLLNAEGDALRLLASAGLDAAAAGMPPVLPLGQSGVGHIAQNKRPHLTNDIANDGLLSNKEWAAREGMAAFAGYPLLAADDRLLGVLAMFSRQPLEQETLYALANVANTLVLGIERKRAEEERIALLEREQLARREAEEASQLKDDFLAMISHELRAPLTAILGWAQMLRSGTLDRTAAERALLTIERNAKTQAHLVGDLLDASRIATGKLRLDKRPIELMQLIESAIDAVRPSVEAKSLRLQIVMEPWVGPFEGDPERMKQIVWNLISNAVKFTPASGLIEVRLERLENKALLIVSDTGQGIEPEFLPYVFERFRQADSSTKRQQGGLGLGLAIVKSLVEMHGGAIYAYSQGKGKGADFMVTLPLGNPETASASKELWQPTGQLREAKGAGTLRGVRVLVVDDERDTREILSVMLTRFGTEVQMAGSAAEGFELLTSWLPDILVSDIGMPAEDGFSFITRVRALEADKGGQTPAIALTAFASTQDRQKAIESGFNVHLSKPVEPVELARVVARTLGRSEAGIEL